MNNEYLYTYFTNEKEKRTRKKEGRNEDRHQEKYMSPHPQGSGHLLVPINSYIFQALVTSYTHNGCSDTVPRALLIERIILCHHLSIAVSRLQRRYYHFQPLLIYHVNPSINHVWFFLSSVSWS